MNTAAASSEGFGRCVRLRAKADYDRVFANAQRSADRCFIVLFCDNSLEHPRLGLAISKRRVRSAAARNRLKRLVRESFRRARRRLPPTDIVVMAGAGAATAANAELFASLQRHWDKIRKAHR